MRFFLRSSMAMLCLFAALIAGAQTVTPAAQGTHACGTTEMFKNNLQQDAGMATRLNQMFTQGNAKNSGNNTILSAPYTIPVVFHIITDPAHPTPAPSYAQIQMQLASLNAAFSNNLNSLNNVPTGPRAVNTQIQFCFAKKRWVNNAPAAWSTNSVGVVYYSVTNTITTNVNINSNASLATLAALTNAQFPPGMYLNIWCVPNISTTGNTSVNAPPGIIGMGTFPWMTAPIDGIVMRSDCIGNNTYNNFPGSLFTYLDRGNILVHEAGHYLGLFHTFETITNSNVATAGGAVGCYGLVNTTTEGDLISDTPPTQINGQVQPGTYNTCNESYAPYGTTPDVNDQLENFMSYSDDDYMNTFTSEQGARMWGALDNAWATTFLTGPRANLVSPANLVNTGVTLAPGCGPGLLNARFNFSVMAASITCNSAPVQFLEPVLAGYLSATTHTWYFGDGSSSTAINPLHTYSLAPYTFTATHVVSDGSSTSTSTMQVSIPSGGPEIVGWSGKGHPVCRGTEQTIFVRFPPYILGAVLTDGTTTYPVQTNVVINSGAPYDYPFTFSITSSGTWSLVQGSCNTPTAVASFTVVDCCENLVYNGSLDAGPVGFTSDYTLTTNNFSNGHAAINAPFGLFQSIINPTGKGFMVDAYGPSGCGVPNLRALLLGQAITGLEPNTNYYIAFKSDESLDSVSYPCPVKYNLKFYCSSSPGLFNKNIIPTTGPPSWLIAPNSGATGGYPMEVHSFMVTTPANITPATTFSLELYEVENRNGLGFDDYIDELIVARMNGALALTPATTSIAACSGTVQLHAAGNCSNIANYQLLWMPSANLSCSTCPNPVASVSAATTVFTLIAIPPITVPPTPNVILTSTVYTQEMFSIAPSASTISACSGTLPLQVVSTCSNLANYSFKWQPAAYLSCSTCLNPVATVSATTIFTLTGSLFGSPDIVLTSTVFTNETFSVTPATTVLPCGSTVQLSFVSSCSNPTSYNLLWQPSANLSCNTCANPVATMTDPTVYTVTASHPGSPNVVLTSFVNVTPTPLNVVTTLLQPCYPTTYSLSVTSTGTATWQPGNIVSQGITVSPVSTIIYSVTVGTLINQQSCPGSTVISFAEPIRPNISVAAQRTVICKGETVSLTVQGAASYSWSTAQTGPAITVAPLQNTSYTVHGTFANGCSTPINSVTVNVSLCLGIDAKDQEQMSLSLYPNPNTGRFFIEADREMELTLFNALGQLISEFRLEAPNHYTQEVNLPSSGIYFISGKKNAQIFVKKIIVSH